MLVLILSGIYVMYGKTYGVRRKHFREINTRNARKQKLETAENTCIDLKNEEPCQQGRLIHFIALRIKHQTRNLLLVRGNLLSNVFSSTGLAECGHFVLAVMESNPARKGTLCINSQGENRRQEKEFCTS